MSRVSEAASQGESSEPWDFIPKLPWGVPSYRDLSQAVAAHWLEQAQGNERKAEWLYVDDERKKRRAIEPRPPDADLDERVRSSRGKPSESSEEENSTFIERAPFDHTEFGACTTAGLLGLTEGGATAEELYAKYDSELTSTLDESSGMKVWQAHMIRLGAMVDHPVKIRGRTGIISTGGPELRTDMFDISHKAISFVTGVSSWSAARLLHYGHGDVEQAIFEYLTCIADRLPSISGGSNASWLIHRLQKQIERERKRWYSLSTGQCAQFETVARYSIFITDDSYIFDAYGTLLNAIYDTGLSRCVVLRCCEEGPLADLRREFHKDSKYKPRV